MNEDNRTICLGCHAILEFADSPCSCSIAEDKRMEEEIAKWEAEHKDDPPPAPGSRLGFVCFEGVGPMRASLKALSRLKID